MSIQTVDLKASKALRDWEDLKGRLIRDPGSFSWFPKGHRDAVISDALAGALVYMAVLRRSRDRFFYRCELRRQICHFLSLEKGYERLLFWDTCGDYSTLVKLLHKEWTERLDVTGGPNAERS